MQREKIKRQFKNFRIYKDLYGKPLKRDWWKELFLSYNPFHFWRQLQLLLLGYVAENLQVT